MADIKIEAGCQYNEALNEWRYDYNKMQGLDDDYSVNGAGNFNITSHHSVHFDSPSDGRPPEIGDFLTIISSVQQEPNDFYEVGTFTRRVGYQSTEGKMRWPKDYEPRYTSDWEDESKKDFTRRY